MLRLLNNLPSTFGSRHLATSAPLAAMRDFTWAPNHTIINSLFWIVRHADLLLMCQIWIWRGLWKEEWSSKRSLGPKENETGSWWRFQGSARLDQDPKRRTLATGRLTWMVLHGWKARGSDVSLSLWSPLISSKDELITFSTFRFADLGKRVSWRQEALDIKTAFNLIKDSQKYLDEAVEAEKASESAVQSQRVKPKGNRSFSDLL